MSYLLFYLAWSCPLLLGRLVPPNLQPLACEPRPQLEISQDLGEHLNKIRKLHPYQFPSVYRCEAQRCEPLRLTWETQPRLEGILLKEE